MSEKIFNTRLQQKYDLISEWVKVEDNFIPKKGEIIVYEVPATTKPDGTISAPQRITKTGDGEHTLGALSFDSALAADVYAWAKAATKPEYKYSEIKELPTIPTVGNGTVTIDGEDNVIQVKAKDSDTFTLNQSDNKTLALTIKNGGIAKTKLATAVQTSLGLADTAVQPAALNDYQPKGNYKTTQTAVSDPAVGNTPAEEFIATISQNANGVISATKQKVKAASVAPGGVTTESIADDAVTGAKIANDAITTDHFADNAKAPLAGTADIATTANKVAKALTFGTKTYDGSSAQTVTASDLGLSQALVFKGSVTTLPTSGMNVGDVYLVGTKEYVYTASGVWTELGDGDSHALKTVKVNAGEGLTGGGDLSTDRGIAHAVPYDASAGIRSGQDYIKTITTDKFGHVTDATYGTDKDTTYSAGTGLKLSGTTFNHSNSITAGTAKGTDTTTLTNGGTFNIPSINYDAQGHITGKGTTTLTLPSYTIPTVGNGTFTVTGNGGLTGSGSMTANQSGASTATLSIADKGVTTAKIADKAVGAAQTKAYTETANGASEEIWVFCCGSATARMINGVKEDANLL